MSEGLTKGEAVPRNVLPELRVGHLLRISGYLEYAFHAMWAERRPQVVMGMAEASVRDTGPGGPEGPDEELLERLRNLSRRRGNTTPRTTSRRRWPGCASPKTSSPCAS